MDEEAAGECGEREEDAVVSAFGGGFGDCECEKDCEDCWLE